MTSAALRRSRAVRSDRPAHRSGAANRRTSRLVSGRPAAGHAQATALRGTFVPGGARRPQLAGRIAQPRLARRASGHWRARRARPFDTRRSSRDSTGRKPRRSVTGRRAPRLVPGRLGRIRRHQRGRCAGTCRWPPVPGTARLATARSAGLFGLAPTGAPARQSPPCPESAARAFRSRSRRPSDRCAGRPRRGTGVRPAEYSTQAEQCWEDTLIHQRAGFDVRTRKPLQGNEHQSEKKPLFRGEPRAGMSGIQLQAVL